MRNKLLYIFLSFAPINSHAQSLFDILNKNTELKEISSYIDNGADVNEEGFDEYGYSKTPLTECLDNNLSFDIIELLVEAGADINWTDATESGHTVLCNACQRGKIDHVKLLIKLGADISRRNSFGETPFISTLRYNTAEADSLRKNTIEILKLLIKNGADVNAQDYFGYTALQHPSSGYIHNSIDIINFLLDEGADINKGTYFRAGNPLMTASTSDNNIEIVKLLLDRGADINRRHYRAGTALMAAASKRNDQNTSNINVVKLLISRGADINICINNEYTALTRATTDGQTELMRLLIENGADVNVKTEEYTRQSILSWAVAEKDIELVKLLIEKGANPNAKDESDRSALTTLYSSSNIFAINDKNDISQTILDIAKLLIEAGSDVNARDNNNTLLLVKATNNRLIEVSKLLLDNGATVNYDICRAIYENSRITDISKIFSDRKIYGSMLLTIGVLDNDITFVTTMIDAGADVNARDEHGFTALSYATIYNRKDIKTALINAGAVASATDNRSRKECILKPYDDVIEPVGKMRWKRKEFSPYTGPRWF